MIDFSRFNSIFELTEYFSTEERCKCAIRDSRWEKGDIVCSYCGKHHCIERKDGRYRCNHCKRNFSVLVGTIFEDTKISLRKWFIAMYLISCHKKGISSVQLATDIHVTQKTAWFILHKCRTLFKQDENVVLSGVVECDEMYLGGREPNKHEIKKTKGTQGGAKTKTPIFGMTMKWKTEEVNTTTGEVYEKTHTFEVAKKVEKANGASILPIIRHFVAEGSTIVTDESGIYIGLANENYKHVFVCHSDKEYTIGSFTTNGIEGFWGHFKRVVFGTYHFVTKAYLERYIDEAVYRFNTKEQKESERFAHMFKAAIGCCDYKTVKMCV